MSSNKVITQGRGESTSNVAFEVLIINCHVEFINLFTFNCLTSNIKIFVFRKKPLLQGEESGCLRMRVLSFEF